MSMVQVVVWMVGDLNYDDNFLNAKLDYPLLSISLFLLLVCTVGAFFVTLLKTPSPNKKRLQYHKQTGRIYLLLKIDICFPWFRNICLVYEYNEKEKIPNLLVKILEHVGYRGSHQAGQNQAQGQDNTGSQQLAMIYNCNIERVVAYFENLADFFQTDDNDDDDDDDDEKDDDRVM